MRRCLHSFLVGVLTLSLTMDTARACWYARRGCRGPMPVAAPCQPSAFAPCPSPSAPWSYAGGCVVVVISDVAVDAACGMPLVDHGCGCGAPVFESAGRIVEGGVVVTSPAESVVAGSQLDEGPAPSRPTPAEQVVAPPPTAVEPPVAPPADVPPQVAAEPEIPALEPAGEPAVDEVRQTTALTEEQPPTEAMPSSTEPEHEPVTPAEPSEESEGEPLGEEPPPAAAEEEEPAPMAEEDVPAADEAPVEPEPSVPEPVEPAPAEPEEPAEPQAPEEPNIFEEVDAGAIDEATEPAEPAPLDEPASEAEPAVDEEMPTEEGAEPAEEGSDAAVDESEPTEEPVAAADEPVTADEEAAADPEPTADEEQPADDAAAGEEPPAAADPFESTTRSREPSRRWIDRTGRYAVVGTLVTVRADGTCVLASGDRLLVVPLDGLSGHDRDYAQRAATRLAAGRAAAPESGDTAGL